MQFKFVTRAGNIPDGETVMKSTGSTPYTLRKQIAVYNEDRTKQVLSAPDVMYLVGNNGEGSINAISVGRELSWMINETELRNFLNDRQDERESQ